MKVSITIRLLLASILSSLGVVSRKLRGYSSHDFVMLMYHRVIPRNEAKKGVQAGIYVEPETFETHLRFMQKYFKIVPISELSFNSRGNFAGPNYNPICALTFDDGWYDFYRYAFPILKAYQIPATVFLPTGFIGSRRWFWTDRLAYLFFQSRKLKDFVRLNQSSTDPVVRQLEKLKGSLESRSEKAIEMLKPIRGDDIEGVLSELSGRWNLDPNPPGRAFLSWEEVGDMAQSGLITFGSHTASHRILTTLIDEEIQDELMRSKRNLIAEKVVYPAFIPFSYPNGNYNEKIAGMVKEAGYSLAITTETGWNHNASDPFALRRVSIHQDMTSTEAMLGCRVVGIF